MAEGEGCEALESLISVKLYICIEIIQLASLFNPKDFFPLSAILTTLYFVEFSGSKLNLYFTTIREQPKTNDTLMLIKLKLL